MDDFEENINLNEEEKQTISGEKQLIDESNNEYVSGEKATKGKSRYDIYGYIKNVFNSLKQTFVRFPLVILYCIVLAGFAIYRVDLPYGGTQELNERLDRIMAVLGLGIPLSLSVGVMFERFYKDARFISKLVSYVMQLVFIVLYYIYFLPKMGTVEGIRLVCVIASLVLAFLFIPYLINKENFEIYIIKLVSRGVVSVFFTVVLGAGVCATLFAIKSLLYSNMSENLYAYTWIISWSVFAPVHFLYGLPSIEDRFQIEHFNKVLKVLLLYIIMPLITIYTLVLYTYFGKVILTRVWPRGIVSYLVLSYTAVGIATTFLITPLKNINGWVRNFTTVYTKAVFPLLIMMFISIGIRIREFGFTENRYFIVLIGIWATLAMIYYNFNKGRRNIILPISLALILIIAVSGSFSAFNISKNSQNHRFYKILVKNNMLKNGQIVKDESLNDNDKREIAGILNYFNSSHSLKELKYIPSGFELNKMKDVFGFSQSEIKNDIYFEPNSYFSYGKGPNRAISIAGYDNLFKLEAYGKPGTTTYQEEVLSGTNKVKVVVDKNYQLVIFKDEVAVYKKNLFDFIKSLYVRYGVQNDLGKIAPGDLIFTDSNENVNVKIVFNAINGKSISGDMGIEINGVDAYLLVKLK